MRHPLTLPLPRGIISGVDLPEEHKITFPNFRAACDLAAASVNGKVRDVYEAYEGEIITYYHEATISYDFGRRNVRVICSALYPVVAFADAGSSRSSRVLDFVDCAPLATALGQELHFVLMSAADAKLAPVSPAIDTLDEQEKQEIDILKPPRIGDAVFKR